MATAKHPGGRPPKYTCKEQIQGLIDDYFESCKGEPFIDPDTGQQFRDKMGYPIFLNQHIPTVTGLALALGFKSRQSLLNYSGKKEFNEVITEAKTRIEAYVEERLFDKDGANGAKFSLQNNFKGWDADKKSEEDGKAPAINIICDIPRVQDPPKEVDKGEPTVE
jgi:hypothetical protein